MTDEPIRIGWSQVSSQVYELHRFISTDYWAFARSQIHDRLGNVYVLLICGAAGDQNPLDLVRLSKMNSKELIKWNAQAGEAFRNVDMEDKCRSIGQRIAAVVVRGYDKAKTQIQTELVFKHKSFTMRLPIRKVSEQDYREAFAVIEEA